MNILKLFLCSLLLLATPSLYQLNAQVHYDWSVSQGGKESDFTGSLRADDQGHLYTMCYITDTADLDPGIGETILIPWFDETTVLTKWTTEGEFLWSSVFQAPGEHGGSIHQIKNNSILVTLYYEDSLVYVRNNIPTNLVALPGKHLSFVTLDLNGNITSFHNYPNQREFYFNTLEQRADGLYTGCGSFSDSLVIQTSHGDSTIYPIGDNDGFIMTMNDQWETVWIRTFGSDESDYVTDLVFANNQIYFVVSYNDTLTVNTASGQVTFPCTEGEENSLFGTMTLNGEAVKVHSFGGDLYDELRAIASDTDGNIYLVGSFEGSVNFQHPDAPPVVFTSSNYNEGFIAKYSPDGFLEWARIIKNSEYGGMHNIRLHRDQSLYVTGGYNGHTDLDPGPDSLIVETTNWGDIYSAKFDKEGNMEWVYNFVGEDLEGIRQQVISPDGRIYLVGFHYDTFDADPSAEIAMVPNKGGTDMFLLAYTEENVITSAEGPSVFDLTLSPNPSTSTVYLSTNSQIETVWLYTMEGVQVQIPIEISSNKATMEVSALQPGMYIARVKSGDAYTSCRFLKL
ncbi:MAG TPA: T9SS type A sorting domain-containing protein [Saprospiraceae bacterium]